MLSTGGTNGWVVGLVVYSGHDTKEMQNSKDASHKQTNFQRKLNRLIVFLFASVCICCLVAGVLGGLWTAQNAKDAASYLDAAADAKQMGFIAFFSYAVLLNTFIPASLVVTVEFVKVVHALFINWDLKMFHGWELSAVTGKPKPLRAAAKAMTLQEELGQITHVFSDKVRLKSIAIIVRRQLTTLESRILARGSSVSLPSSLPPSLPPSSPFVSLCLQQAPGCGSDPQSPVPLRPPSKGVAGSVMLTFRR